MSLATLCKMFEDFGYQRCTTGTHEKGFHKVALYGLNGVVKHAAIQLETKGWSSKLGKDVDIRHDSVSGVMGQAYGDILQFMKRPVPQAAIKAVPAKKK
jgi:hypothetical protein